MDFKRRWWWWWWWCYDSPALICRPIGSRLSWPEHVGTSPVVQLAQGWPANNWQAAATQPRTLDHQVTSQVPCSHGHRGTQKTMSGWVLRKLKFSTRSHSLSLQLALRYNNQIHSNRPIGSIQSWPERVCNSPVVQLAQLWPANNRQAAATQPRTLDH